MARLIDADVLIKKIKKEGLLGDGYSYDERESDVIEMIEECDTIDAEPMRHGHWIKNNDRDGWSCSICHKNDCYAYLYNYDTDVEDIQDYYCPYCGAKMDAETKHE